MKYTIDQLTALVQEARGHVHDIMMGAIWTKQRYTKCAKFMERTVEIGLPEDQSEEVMVVKAKPVGKTTVKPIAKPVAKDVHLVLTNPEIHAINKAKELISGGYVAPDKSSIDKEADSLRFMGVQGSRDFLRLVVKELRSRFG